jgi:hypothetical protein
MLAVVQQHERPLAGEVEDRGFDRRLARQGTDADRRRQRRFDERRI